MANTVYHYAPTNWVNGTTPANATNLNHLETQAIDVLSGINPDLFTAFVLSGITCTKDGTNANQLDIASGRAYVTQTDGTLALIVVAADNTHTTSALSSTYHLYLQPDGTWYWNTANAPAANSLFIAQVTTDASGNILAVTDERTLISVLLSGAAGGAGLPKVAQVAGQATAGSFGMPMIVAQVSRVHVTATTVQTILTYNIPVNGLYEASAGFFYGNPTQENVKFFWTFTDSSGIAGAINNFYLPGAGVLGGGTPVGGGSNQDFNLVGGSFHANVGTLTVTYQDPGGTPNDTVSFQLRRLA